MKTIETALPGVIIIEPSVFSDDRGFFKEIYHSGNYHETGIRHEFVQDNHSRSKYGVLRGLHYQLEQPQGKLVTAIRGEIFDVAVDIRQGSPTFGRWVGVILSDHNHWQLYIPPDFAHGFCVLSPEADVLYKCTQHYHAASEWGIAWNDPQVDIHWPLQDVLVSAKDAGHPHLQKQWPERLPHY